MSSIAAYAHPDPTISGVGTAYSVHSASAAPLTASDFIDLFLEGAKHDERALLMFRRKYPYQNREERLAGAFLGLDYDKAPFAGLCLLSREEMPDDDVRATVSSLRAPSTPPGRVSNS